MAKDSLQPTWLKTLSSIVSSSAVDSTGAVWVGDLTGTLIKFSATGIPSEPIKLDNPIYSVTVDQNTDSVYVGDSANNVFKYSATGELKWGKNLGNGNQAKIPLVSTINDKEPDTKGNLDLSYLYYTKQAINDKLAPLGRTKSLNGIVPDEAGNITLDLSSFYNYRGDIDSVNITKATETGWYTEHSSDGATSTLLVYANKNNITQISIGNDHNIKLRTSQGSNGFTDWDKITKNVKTINDIKPDANGNVKLDLTGNIKTVNFIKPDANGNIQLGAGTTNSVKSVNTDNIPDDKGNVTVPTFAPNLLKGTTSKKQVISKNSTVNNANLLSGDSVASWSGEVALGTSEHSVHGEMIVSDAPVEAGHSYTYNFNLMTTPESITYDPPFTCTYTQYRKSKVKLYFVFTDVNDNEISQNQHVHTVEIPAQDTVAKQTITDTIVAPEGAVGLSIFYDGLADTSENLVIGSPNCHVPYGAYTNNQDQLIDLPAFAMTKALSNERLVVKLQAKVTNYKKGSFVTVKSKDIANSKFKLDSSKLDSDTSLLKPIIGVDTNNLVTGDGFYSWEYTLSATDLVTNDVKNGLITLVTDIVGEIQYTIKVSEWASNAEKPDMEWIPASTTNSGIKTYPKPAYTLLNFWACSVYELVDSNQIELGRYNLKNDYVDLLDTVGKYSASTNIDMNDGNGRCRLILAKLDGNNKVIQTAESQFIPFYDKKDSEQIGNFTRVSRGVLKTNSIDNVDPVDTDSIVVYLQVFGLSKDIKVSQVKLSQWKDGGKTPPDLTWLPNVEDVLGGVRTVQDKEPDSQGNIDLSSEFVKPSAITDFVPKNKLSDLYALTKSGVKKTLSGMVDFNSITANGVYRLNTCYFASDIKPRGVSLLNFSGWLFVLDYDETPLSASMNIYQLIVADSDTKHFNAGIYFRKLDVSATTKARFNIIALDSDVVALSDKVTSMNTTVDMLSNKNPILSINDIKPSSTGAFTLNDFEHPTKTFQKNQQVDVDNMKTAGIYSLFDANVFSSVNTSALDGLPRTTDGTTMAGYLIVLYHDSWNIEQILLLNTGLLTPDVVAATRSISGETSFRPKFRKLLNTDDYTTLYNSISSINDAITSLKNKFYKADNMSMGIAYAKDNKNTLVYW